MIRHIPIIMIIFLIIGCTENKGRQINLDRAPEKVELFAPNYISTNLNERDIAIAPTGSEVIHTLGNFDQSQRCLVGIRLENGNWSNRQLLSFSGTYNDIEPFYAPDGKKLFFASDRPLRGESESGDYNIWVVEMNDFEWGQPLPLDTIINTENDEFYPSISQNGNLYFTAIRDNGIGSEDIFISKLSNGHYLTPEPLDTMINTATYEFNAYISPDETLIVFSSYGRADDMGGGDLYFSKKDEEGNWMPAQNAGDHINSTKLDYCPFVDIVNGNIYFTSNRIKSYDSGISTVEDFCNRAYDIENGMGNIYRINLDHLINLPIN